MIRGSKLFPYLRPNLPPEDVAYLDMHARRFQYTLNLALQCLPEKAPGNKPLRILDIGPHFLTMILRHDTNALVSQVGFDVFYGPNIKPRAGEEHYVYDFDATIDHSAWPKLPPHDVVCVGEVIEHLHTSPNHWFPFLKSCMAPGASLIITTPNGVSLRRRVMMIAGVHPYEKIRDDPKNPGHFREYTKGEVVAYAESHGLRLVHFSGRAHLDYPNMVGKIYNRVTTCLPTSLRDSMYFVFRNEVATPEAPTGNPHPVR